MTVVVEMQNTGDHAEMKALKMAGIAPPRAWQKSLAEYIETFAVPA